jgi:hypothetical protein
LGELHSAGAKLIEVRSGNFRAKTAEVGIAQIIREQDDDVWPERTGSCWSGASEAGDGQQGASENRRPSQNPRVTIASHYSLTTLNI